MRPKAIRDRFFAEDLGDETVVYNSTSREARSLNSTASYVWKQCDGKTSMDEIGNRVASRFEVKEGAEIAALAVEELRSAGMIECAPSGSGLGRSVSRRALLGKLAVASVLLPVVSAAAQTKPPKKHTSFVPKRTTQGGNDF